MSVSRTLVSLGLGVGLGLAAPAAASDRDFPVDPGSLSVRQSARGTKMTFRARKGSVAANGGEAPTLSGAQLQVFDSAGGTDDLCAQLPASNWRVSGTEPGYGAVSWTYRDPRNTYGPVRGAHFGRVGRSGFGDIRVLLRGGTYTLDEPSQGSIAVTLRMSNLLPPPDADHTRYCTDFAPPYATIGPDAPGVFRARFNSPNEFGGPCPAAPSACSPGGAFLDPD